MQRWRSDRWLPAVTAGALLVVAGVLLPLRVAAVRRTYIRDEIAQARIFAADSRRLVDGWRTRLIAATEALSEVVSAYPAVFSTDASATLQRRRLQSVLVAWSSRMRSEQVWVLDRTGDVVASGPPGDITSPERQAAVAVVADGQPRVVGPRRYASGQIVFAAVTPVYGSANAARIVGAVVRRIPAEEAIRSLTPRTPDSSTWLTYHVAATDSEIVVISPLKRPAAPPLTLRWPIDKAPAYLAAVTSRRDTSGTFVDFTGHRVGMAAARADSLGWTFVTQKDESEIVESMWPQIRLEALLAAGVIALVVLVVVIVLRAGRAARLRHELETETRLSSIMRSSDDIVLLADAAGNAIDSNRAAAALLALHPGETSALALFDPESLTPVREALARSIATGSRERIGSTHAPIRLRGASAESIPAEATISTVVRDDVRFTAFVIRDLRDQIQLEEQLRQGQRMKAVGRLAGGIAHDFNNLLMIVSANTEALASELTDQSQLQMLKDVTDASSQAAALTKQLMVFGGVDFVSSTVHDLNVALRDAAAWLPQITGEGVALSFRYSAVPLPVVIDAAHIRIMLRNLAQNAREAMPDGGRLEIVASRDPAQPEWASLDVSDSGAGMSNDTKRRIFEPFFTTKAAARGVGFGLSAVYAAVSHAGGSITFDSAPGRGTRFRIRLPLVTPVSHPSGRQSSTTTEHAAGTRFE